MHWPDPRRDMLKTLLIILFPPYAVCRYGCINSCALPIAGLWLGGIFLLGYHVIEGRLFANELIRTGSLAAGLGLIGLSIAWTQTTISRVTQGNHTGGGRGLLCRVIPSDGGSSPDEDDDPLAEVERARKL